MGIGHRNKNDALSVQMWALKNRESNFFSQKK